MAGFTYILRCSDGSFYVGSTTNLDARIQQHRDGLGSNYTQKRLPIEVVFVMEFQRIRDAYLFELQIKGWSRRKKVALIEQNIWRLKAYSICQNETHYSRFYEQNLTDEQDFGEESNN